MTLTRRFATIVQYLGAPVKGGQQRI